MEGEKTEQPTPKHREDARKKGQIVQSQDLNKALTLMTVSILIAFIGPPMFVNIGNMIRHFILLPVGPDGLNTNIVRVDVLSFFFTILTPLLIMTAMVTILILGIQTKFAFFEEKIKLSLERLDPVRNVKNMFTMRQAVMPVLIFGKVSAILIVAYVTVTPMIKKWLSGMLSDTAITSEIWLMVMQLIFRTAVLLIIIGIIDYAVQWRVMEKNLMMTKEEIKEEYKREELPMEVKKKQRERMYKLSQARMMQQVPEASVVITNPTTLAVALKYEEKTMDTPEVIAKGQDLVAKKIKEIAKQEKIPIIEDKPLARAMYSAVEIGDPIPSQFFQAVATILAYIYKRTKKK